MAHRNWIAPAKLRQYRADPLYQVIVEDILSVFGYGKDSAEFAKFVDYMNGKLDKPEQQDTNG